MTERMRSQDQAFEMSLLRGIQGFTLFKKVRSSETRNLLTSSRYFSVLKDLSFGHVSKMSQKRLPNKLYLPKQMGEDQSDDLKLDGPITLRILDEIAWDFTQTK